MNPEIKVCILAGGLGTRLGSETDRMPKPLVEIGGAPILWHIMKIFSAYNFNSFVIALGFRGSAIKDYFVEYNRRSSDLRVDLRTGKEAFLNSRSEPWIIDLLDTGLHSNTAQRIVHLCRHLGPGTFMLTYGDGLANIDLGALLAFHRSHGKLATVTAVRPPARFGAMTLEGERVTAFREKPVAGDGWINGGFFVLETGMTAYVADDDTAFEHGPLSRLAEAGELMSFRHEGFWQCVDTPRDLVTLNALWEGGACPWSIWSRDAE